MQKIISQILILCIQVIMTFEPELINIWNFQSSKFFEQGFKITQVD